MTIPTEYVRPSKELRFGVEDAATGKVSGAFKVVRGGNDDDLYVLKPSDLGHHFKASWHGDSWTVSAGGQASGFANQQWPSSAPPVDGATDVARILVTRSVALREPDGRSDSIVYVTLDDKHEAALFQIWLTPSTVRGIVTKPGRGVIGLLRLHSGRHNAVVVARWLEQVPEIPPLWLVDPGDSRRMLDGAQRPSKSLSLWGVHESRILVVVDMPSLTVNIANPC